MASIRLKNIVKTYPGGVTAVHDFNLEIADQEFIVLVGPSGCGKSTTLRMIAGLEDISSGELFIGERLVNEVAPKDRDIAMVFQNYALYPHMSIYKNLAFSLELRKVPKQEIDRKVRETAKMLDIEHLLDRKPRALSGGQRQRVALGRAMVRNPAVFLLDEPLSNLDAKLRASMRAEIAALHKRLKTTFVYVTHDQTEAMTMGDRIIVMKDGYIQQAERPQVIYDRPCNLFVAGFIGSPQMNFLDVVLEHDGKGYFMIVGQTEFRIPHKVIGNQDLSEYADKPVVLGIRPENTFPCAERGQTFVNARVELREHMGAEVFLHIDFQGNRLISRVSALDAADTGEEIHLTFDIEKIHLFDKDTEKSLLY